MTLQKLYKFTLFDWIAFSKDKVLRVTGSRPWVDFNTKEEIGTRIDVVIAKDNTDYNDSISNEFEKLSIKVRKRNVSIPRGAIIQLANAECCIYGDYRNQLSIKANADDIHVITPQQKQ